MRTKGYPFLKQYQSCAKAISVALITACSNLHVRKISEDGLEENISRRMKEIQRKYGYALFMKVIPEIIDKVKKKPAIMMNFPEGTARVRLRPEYLEKYYNKLKGGEK